MPETPKKRPFLASQWIGFGIEIALIMLLPILAGQWLDDRFEIRPVGIVVGALFGFVGFIWNLYKKTKDM